MGLFITVAVPTYRREKVLCDTLANLLDQDYADYETVVVDQTARHRPETVRYLDSVRDRIRYFRIDEANLPYARNVCVEKSAGEVVLFVDDDVEVGSDFVRAHAENYADRDVYAVAGSVLETRGQRQRDVRPQKSYLLGRAHLNLDSAHRGVVKGGRGCNVSFRREIFELVGLFDARLPPPFLREDTDLYLRMNRRGLRIIYDPKAKLYHIRHPGGGTAEQKTGADASQRRLPWLRYESYLCETVFQLKNFSLITFPAFVAYFLAGWVILRNLARPLRMAKSFTSFVKGVVRGVGYYRERYVSAAPVPGQRGGE